MPRPGTIGAGAMFMLILVIAAMMPFNYGAQDGLAILLIGTLFGVFTYTVIESKLRSKKQI
jgi:hypothetical protein